MQICIQEMKGCNAFSIKCTAAIILSVMICIFSSVPSPAKTETFSSDVVPASQVPELPAPVDSALVESPPDSTQDRLAINNIKTQNTVFLFNSFSRYEAAEDSAILNKVGSRNMIQLSGRDSLAGKSLSQINRSIEGKAFIHENAVLTQSDSLAILIKVFRKRPLAITWYRNWERTKTNFDTLFAYKPEANYQNVDTVTAVVSDLRSDSTLIRSWYLMKPVTLDSAGIFVYRLSADSTFFEIDTLRYQGLGEIFADSAFAEYVNSGDSVQQYLQTMQVDSNTTDSSLIRSVLEGFSKDLATDSIPQIFTIDSLFRRTDSLSAASVTEDQLRDRLLSDSLFQDTSADSGEKVDSLSVIMADSLIDSTRNTQDAFQAESGDSALSIQSYLPAADTVCTYGDTLRFYTQPQDGGEQHIFFQWFVNDSLIEGESDSVFIFIPVRDAHSIDTVSVSISDTSNNYIGEISWQIAKQEPKNFMPEILSFLPKETLLSFSKDTLDFSVSVYDQEQDSINYQWFLNDSLLHESADTVYSYFPGDSVNFSDTIRVAVWDSRHDSTIEMSWIIALSPPEFTTPFLEAFPAADTLLAIRDSLLFGSYLKNIDPDTIDFKWLLNGQIIENADDSTYLYFCRDKFQKQDTLTLVVSSAEKDTITNHQWIISKYSSSEVIDELIFSPEADTFVTKGDSLLISVVCNVGEDSLKYVWFLNGELIYDHPDSIYTYIPDTAGFKIDTVQLFVIDAINDTSRAHEWLISNEKPRIPLKLAAAFPATDTTLFRGDSLQFLTRLQEPRPDSVSFRWFVNEEEILSENDSLFQYLANDSLISSDSIQVFISNRDTIIHLVWQVTVLEKRELYQLEAPELIYPVNHEQISDDGKFIWSIDSLDTFDNEDCRYVFQISTDTLFADIVVSDTVEADTFIRFDQIPDRDKIIRQQPYFWRVQAIDKNAQMSDFRICGNDFSYLPPFIELTNFYAERNTKGHIVIYWETGYEMQNFGFNIYRSRKSSDNFIKINEDVVTGEKSYSFVDETVTAGETFYYQLEEICKNGDKKMHPAITVEMPMPENFNLFPNYPNPFNTITLVRYQLPAASQVTIDIYNVLGRRIRNLVDEVKEAGFYTVTWDGLDSDGIPVVSGLYFYRMHAGSFKTTRKMTVVR